MMQRVIETVDPVWICWQFDVLKLRWEYENNASNNHEKNPKLFQKWIQFYESQTA